jgi:hypothetical protein
MKHITILLLAVCCFSVHARTSGGDVVCYGKYALCSSAKCVPVPGSKGKSVCNCIVEDGASLGNLSCEERKPRVEKYGAKLIYSSFSFRNKPWQMLKCPSGKAWTFCLDMPCFVSPHDPKKAICTCDVKTTGEFYTEGGACNPDECSNHLWSAATSDALTTGTSALLKAIGLKKSPIQICPTKQ